MKAIFFILFIFSQAYASFDSVSTALEGYIQSSYELSSKEGKVDPKLYRTLIEEKQASIATLLAQLK